MPVDPLPVIVGCPRSGTSLLAVMLDSHPRLAIPPETSFIRHLGKLAGSGDALRLNFFRLVTFDKLGVSAWSDCGLDTSTFWQRLLAVRPFTLTGGLRAFYTLYAEQSGKARCGDKTPAYVRLMPEIESLLPEAHFIHLIRDPRPTVLSWRNTWFAPSKDVATLAVKWAEHVAAGRAAARVLHHYLEVRYEDLVLAPEATLRAVCDFIGLDYAPAMLDYEARGQARLDSLQPRTSVDGSRVIAREERTSIHANLVRPPQTARVRQWETEMAADERRAVEEAAGPLMRELGYDR
ncbi:MAG: sulfotransferase [Betaproteobacteria bacterium]